MKTVWVFNGERSSLPAGVFSSRNLGDEWICNHCLSGTLSEFPLDQGAYDHAIQRNLFCPRKAHESQPEFISDFSPRLSHYHYKDGRCDT